MYSDIDILETVKTNLDREELLYEINQIKSSLYLPKKKLEEVLQSKVRFFVANFIKSKIEKGDDLEKYLDGLIKALVDLEEIRLEVALEPTNEEVEIISNWLSKNIGKKVVVLFEVMPKILGGAVISFRGKYFDGSLLKELEEVLARNKEDLIKQVYLQK